ncbi:hypothetical protein KUCAC02_015606 [Chaenocephalus aceratus]|uniref:Uncharacterized protein n=1 Tax=Chaenocephalus aceratus TaxID=36190 RepID=A0ACB9Y0A7_CHAAC|nr:hypothetical protein KUCAC02_015606 [Chaenocephalus aceratus]
MRACLVFLCLLSATFALSVKSKHHGKHHGLHKTSHKTKEKDIVTEEANEPQILPTLVTFEASSQEQDDEELSSQDNANASKQEEEFEVTEKSDKPTAVLLSKEESDETVESIAEDEGQEEEDKLEMEEKEVNKEIVGDAEMLEKEEKEVEKSGEIVTDGKTLLEETDGSTESEIPVDLDYAADSGILPLQIISAQIKPHTHDIQPPSKEDIKEKETSDKTMPTIADEEDVQNTQAMDPEEPKSNTEFESESRLSEETQSGQEQSQQDPQPSEASSIDNTVQKAKRRRAGKWGPLVGMNPVQIRATVDLYPGSRPSPGGGVHRPESPADPCDNFPCKRGKTCKLDADKKPGCVCQEPADCPHSANQFDNVCGTNNKTYDTSCELFATKCNLEGTKRGHRLHMDYTGPCKFIPQCVDTELVQFPLRMRDWLKNVLLQLFEHDSMSPGFLTPKQRFRVKKIFESERRLHAGDHSVELLAQDFEKNYNMYIYPVHWQFAQLDQHPSDRILSHSELAPLRVPLVPMEHCTSRFFQECDADKDKQVSFKEWTSCFGIKNDDMDVNLLF